jgi:monovalent cation:H+ antiporter-2, CPA2 family
VLPEPVLFCDLAAVFIAAMVGGAVAWVARQPLILGYVLGGIAIGPFTPEYVERYRGSPPSKLQER